MPLYLCAECLKNYSTKETDAFYKIYCFHTYAKLKAKKQLRTVVLPEDIKLKDITLNDVKLSDEVARKSLC